MVGIDTLTDMAGHLLVGRKGGTGEQSVWEAPREVAAHTAARPRGTDRGFRRPDDTAHWPAGRSRHGGVRRAAPSDPCRENAYPHDIHPGQGADAGSRAVRPEPRPGAGRPPGNAEQPGHGPIA